MRRESCALVRLLLSIAFDYARARVQELFFPYERSCSEPIRGKHMRYASCAHVRVLCIKGGRRVVRVQTIIDMASEKDNVTDTVYRIMQQELALIDGGARVWPRPTEEPMLSAILPPSPPPDSPSPPLQPPSPVAESSQSVVVDVEEESSPVAEPLQSLVTDAKEESSPASTLGKMDQESPLPPSLSPSSPPLIIVEDEDDEPAIIYEFISPLDVSSEVEIVCVRSQKRARPDDSDDDDDDDEHPSTRRKFE